MVNAINSQSVEQAVVVPMDKPQFSKTLTRIALFNEDGTPFNPSTGGPTSSPIAIDTDGVPYLTGV